jgi:hypothetical protein
LYLGVVASVGLINEYCTTRININIWNSKIGCQVLL